LNRLFLLLDVGLLDSVFLNGSLFIPRRHSKGYFKIVLLQLHFQILHIILSVPIDKHLTVCYPVVIHKHERG
jgi:hypothetical protein